MATLSVKLVIDKEANMIVFAESNKNFVDILFSFLTLQMGTIVRLLGKKSDVGCMDNFYESVENLDMKYLQTKACRMMLLQPRGASEKQCEDLVINADDLEPRRVYRCPNIDCLTKTHFLFSNVPDAQCPCGEVINTGTTWMKRDVNKTSGGIFVKGIDSFMITDDLNILPISTGTTLSLLQRLGITALENRTVEISREEEEHHLLRKQVGNEHLGLKEYKDMQFTHCVINEGLRLGNIVKFAHRKAIKPIYYKDYEIPAGWKVLPIFCGVHLDPSLNRFAARLTSAEVARISGMDEWSLCFRTKICSSTTKSWDFMGLTLNDTLQVAGEGDVIVGVLDTGDAFIQKYW